MKIQIEYANLRNWYLKEEKKLSYINNWNLSTSTTGTEEKSAIGWGRGEEGEGIFYRTELLIHFLFGLKTCSYFFNAKLSLVAQIFLQLDLICMAVTTTEMYNIFTSHVLQFGTCHILTPLFLYHIIKSSIQWDMVYFGAVAASIVQIMRL